MNERAPNPPPPVVYEGQLDAQQLIALRDDLDDCAEIVHVQIRGAVTRGLGRRVQLSEAFEHVLAGDLHSVQVRYRYQGTLWCDTLLVTGGGVRLVRVRADES